MENSDLKKLLEQHRNGTLPRAEHERLKSTFAKLSENGSWDWTEEEKTLIGKSIKSNIERKINSSGKVRRMYSYVTAAACFLLLISFGLYFYSDKKSNPNAADTEYLTASVLAGKKQKIYLSDGSSVLLNGSSKIRYAKTFNSKVREVFLLEGEAFFDVKHNDKLPFIVKAGSTQTQVLGTAFNVRCYKNLGDVSVTVLRGKVSVNPNRTASAPPIQSVLLPGEQLTVNNSDHSYQKMTVKTDEAFGWQTGKLVFNNEKLGRITEILQHSFNVKINYQQPNLKKIKCTAAFDQSDSVNNIMYALCTANNIRYTINNQEITLYNR